MATDDSSDPEEEIVKKRSNVGKWAAKYQDLSETRRYADETTYELAAAFLEDVDEVEDWGCGSGGFRAYCRTKYSGIDGSPSPFVDRAADLVDYQSTAGGILLRHVLEHNIEWERILENALESFRQKLCIVVFTPFSDETKVIQYYPSIDVVDISFRREEFVRHFNDYDWTSEEDLVTESQYGVEHVFYIRRKRASDAG